MVFVFSQTMNLVKLWKRLRKKSAFQTGSIRKLASQAKTRFALKNDRRALIMPLIVFI